MPFSTMKEAEVSELRAHAQKSFDLVGRVTEMLIDGLDLPDDPARVDPDQPLFGRGLELDSLDTLEIVSLIDEEYSVTLEDTPAAFGSINKIVDQLCDRRS